MDHRRGGGRSSSRLRDRLARMFRPGSLLRSTCNNAAASTSSSLGGGAKSDKTRRLLSNPYGFSTSDDADTDGDDVFSSDADDRVPGAGGGKKGEAEAFFSSSRSFSSDSSEFYTKKKTKPKKKSPSSIHSAKPPPPPPPPPRTTRQRRKRRAASSCDTCGVRDGFRPVVSAAEEQVRRGFAVVKRSRDPYADFRSSMVEMVFGRQLFGAAELERLLRSYLSLNAPRHHPVILQAFSDIWVVLHGG
uniref:Transcription repressor n=1 Tax=Oryza brachyantha TaxID=4533 RepID=J3KXW3_ORYBR